MLLIMELILSKLICISQRIRFPLSSTIEMPLDFVGRMSKLESSIIMSFLLLLIKFQFILLMVNALKMKTTRIRRF